MFAIALTLVVLFSTAVLLYQYWSGTLVSQDESASDPPVDIGAATASGPSFHVDTAA